MAHVWIGAGAAQQADLVSKSPDRFHGIVRQSSGITIAELRQRGLTVLQVTPQEVLVAGSPAAMEVAELPDPPAKVSPALREVASEGAIRFLAEFHPDVTEADGRTIVGGEGLLIHEHPDLVSGHLLLEGTIEQIDKLARWDEVAYLWPASVELNRGEPVHGCVGALTEFGPIGQYVATIGAGWDGPGLGSSALLYSIQRGTSKLSAVTLEQEIRRALTEWSSVVKVDFTPGGSPSSPRHLNIIFTAGAHGDPFPFDGRGKVLAHTFYPAPPNPEPLAGDLHFDEDENWQTGADTDVYSVVLHELGHALGLGHSDRPDAVMYAYYRRASRLTAEDIRAIRSLYAARDASTPENPQPPSAPENPTPPSTPPPTTPPSTIPDRVAPTVTIVSPSQTAVVTSADKVVFRGTARDNIGVALVTWRTAAGASGTATGTSSWATPEIALYRGVNYVTITAYDAAGNFTWRSAVVTRR